MRATKLDACGRTISAECSAIVTDGFISVAFSANVSEGEEITATNASGRQCVNVPGVPEFLGYGLEITMCEVSPELYAMLTGQAVVYDLNGDAVGFRVSAGVDLSQVAWALELWSDVPGVACSDDPNEQGSFGYLVLPFVSGGVLGDFTLENNAVTFTIGSASTKSGSAWGTGPYDVVMGSGGAGPLLEPIGDKDHLHAQWTSVAPPAVGDCIASGPPAESVTAGTPGTWGPVDSFPPRNLADLQASSITGTGAWTSGQYVVLGDGSEAHWDGSAWVAGRA
jgi:hypothetical protein